MAFKIRYTWIPSNTTINYLVKISIFITKNPFLSKCFNACNKKKLNANLYLKSKSKRLINSSNTVNTSLNTLIELVATSTKPLMA